MWVDAFISWLQVYFAPLFTFIQNVITPITDFLTRILSVLPPFATLILLSLLTWWLSRLRIAIFALLGFLLIYNLGLWDATIQTISLVLTSTIFSVVIGIPLGLWAGRSDKANKVIHPIMDFMQTMPAFVYLIPAVFFFALGATPAIIASVVFAMPPTIRLTSLGLRQVPKELTEAADAFGSTPTQRLFKVEIPLATKSILAGINQTIMLSLSMVVISSMIGAGGLGNLVLQSISRLQVGKGFEAGLAIVIIAIVLDRITQNIGNVRRGLATQGGIREKYKRWFATIAGVTVVALMIGAYTDRSVAAKKVSLSYVSWDSEVASTNVVKAVLEKKGYQVDLKETEAGPMWTGVATGSIDAHVAGWLPVTGKAYAERYKGQYEDLGINLKGTFLGLVVPKYVPLKSIDDLREAMSKFQGQIIGIDPGSGIMQGTEKALKEYHLPYKLVSGSDAAMVASLDKAYKAKKWIVITGWQPHWMFAKYDLKFLEDPKRVYGGAENIHTIVRKGLKEEKPEVYRILDQFQWTKKDMESVMLEIQKGTEPAKAAKKWVDTHEDIVNNWIK